MKELCVTCKKETKYNKEDHIDYRVGYIEGAGQLCLNCYDELYIKPKLGVKNEQIHKSNRDIEKMDWHGQKKW